MQVPDDWKWLFSPEGQEVLKLAESLPNQDDLKLLTVLREKYHLAPEYAALAVQQIKLRERGKVKFPETANRMFFTSVGLEQSTDAYVAAYKASRFPKGVPIADICCGIGGDLSALALEHPVLGVDASPLVAAIAERNLEVIMGDSISVEGRVRSVTAEEFLTQTRPEDFPCIHIDPDRRSEGVRTSQIVWFSPGLDVIEQLIKDRQTAAVKLAPGTKVPVAWLKKADELEWIGRNRECRELLVWFRDGTRQPEGALRRATILKAHSSEVAWTICGRPGIPVAAAEVPGRYIFDVDSSILAADLEGEVAQKYNLSRIGEGSVYLTGQNLIINSGISCFEILTIVPLDKKNVIKEARKLGWTNPEIKKRGNVPEPGVVRKWFHGPENKVSGTIILVQTTGRSFAVFCERKVKTGTVQTESDTIPNIKKVTI